MRPRRNFDSVARATIAICMVECVKAKNAREALRYAMAARRAWRALKDSQKKDGAK